MIAKDDHRLVRRIEGHFVSGGKGKWRQIDNDAFGECPEVERAKRGRSFAEALQVEQLAGECRQAIGVLPR